LLVVALAGIIPSSMATIHATRRRPKDTADDDAPWLDALDRCNIAIPASARNLEGFVDWVTSAGFPEHAHASFISGEILIDMSPEELETHGVVKAEVYRVVTTCNREMKLGKFYPDGCLVTNKAADLSTEPDGTFVTRTSLRLGHVRLVPRKGYPGQYIELRGTPDWILEVVSKSSVIKDKRKLWKQYHRAGIPEYWLIDARGEETIFQILHWRRKSYVSASKKDGWQWSRVFGRSFRLERVKDELGLWDYTLHVRANDR
jgi:Uma2 family endonuclease